MMFTNDQSLNLIMKMIFEIINKKKRTNSGNIYTSMTVLQGEWKEQHNNQLPHLEHVDDGDEGEEEQGDDEEGEQEGGGERQQQQDTRDSQVHCQQQQ